MTAPTTFAKGVNKVIAFGAETTFGVASAATGQVLRRVSSNFALNTSLIPSAEIIPSQQIRDARQGPRAVSGTLQGQLSPGSYTAFVAALQRGTFAALPNTGTLTDLTLSTGGGTLPPFTYNIASAATVLGVGGTGFLIGDIVYFTGLTGSYVSDNMIPVQVISNTGNGGKTLQVFGGLGSPALTLFTTQSGVVHGAAKKVITPQTGQLFPSFTYEEWFSDVGISDLYLGCEPTQMQIQLPARGWCTFSLSFVGQNMTESTSQFFTGATAPTTTPSMMMIGGSVQYNGTQILYMSSANLSLSTPIQNDPVIGSNLSPAIFQGPLSCTGSFTSLTAVDTMTTDFLAENEVSLSLWLATANSPTAGYINIWLPRVKLGAATKSDSQTAITRSYTFQALENTVNANANDSTVIIYDSAA